MQLSGGLLRDAAFDFRTVNWVESDETKDERRANLARCRCPRRETRRDSIILGQSSYSYKAHVRYRYSRQHRESWCLCRTRAHVLIGNVFILFANGQVLAETAEFRVGHAF